MAKKAIDCADMPSHPNEPSSKKPISHRPGTNSFVAGGKKGKGKGKKHRGHKRVAK